jgi:hypothetical protein
MLGYAHANKSSEHRDLQLWASLNLRYIIGNLALRPDFLMTVIDLLLHTLTAIG